MSPSQRIIWFKRKRYGYGWVPCTWQGWLIITIYIVGLIKMANDLLPESASSSPTRFFVGMVIWTILLLVIAYRTGESPRWQWGKDENK
ncbi:MAG: hypothetical protein ACK42D_02150 [Candidatus Paceibacteria bacterium]